MYRYKLRIKRLEKQNEIQAKQISWCASMIFTLVEVLND